MAMKIEAGDTKRTETFLIFPDQIKVDPTKNARSPDYPRSEKEIESLARSIDEFGQLQPVLVRRLADKTVELVMGFGRHAAVAWINEHLRKDNPLRLQCVVTECNEEQAFLRSIDENLQRNETDPIDDAYNQQQLRERYGWTEEKIAEKYQKSVSAIVQNRRLLLLSRPLQQEVKRGLLPMTAATELVDLPEELREDTINQSRKSNGKVDGSKVRIAVANHKIKSGGTANIKPRSLKEIKDFLAELTGPAENERLKELATSLTKYINRRLGEEKMEERLREFVGAKPRQRD